jgi:hypothetical protein
MLNYRFINNSNMTHESLPPIQTTPEETAQNAGWRPGERLADEQLDTLKRYLLNAADRNRSGEHFADASTRMKGISEQVGDELGLGEIAISGVALGSLSRNPVALRQFAPTLAERMVGIGMQREHVSILLKMQQSFGARPGAGDIGLALKSGLGYLDRRAEDHHEDTSRAKVAFLASGLAATQDVSLRRAILKQLQA